LIQVFFTEKAFNCTYPVGISSGGDPVGVLCKPLESLQCWIKGRGGPREGTIKREGEERNEKEGRRDQDHGDHPKFYDRSPPLGIALSRR